MKQVINTGRFVTVKDLDVFNVSDFNISSLDINESGNSVVLYDNFRFERVSLVANETLDGGGINLGGVENILTYLRNLV